MLEPTILSNQIERTNEWASKKRDSIDNDDDDDD